MNATATATATATLDMSAWPWAQPLWERTVGGLDTLHHALLISGVGGIAKREFALRLCQLLLCDAADDKRAACGRCRNCTLFAAATHPDCHVLTTELEWRDGRCALVAQYCDRYQDIGAREKRANPSRVIPVDQVRALGERFATHAHIAARKVALLVPADRMNANAANALLKLLEEPPSDSTLILVSASPGYLPATIRSRCVQIALPPPSAEAARAWLGERLPAAEAEAAALAHGGPLDALALSADGFLAAQTQLLREAEQLAAGKVTALEFAAQLLKHDFARVLDWLHRLCCALIKSAAGGDAPLRLPAPPPAEALFVLYDRIGNYRRIARDQLNEQLALEELALGLRHALSLSARR